jgi:eukaryotic-like serine/threonine-protein kinase
VESFVITVDLRPGAVFHSRYEIRGPLGRGGMGMVFKAHDRSLDETVAIKILRPEFAQDAKMGERFRSEIKLARKVRHRNVCTIHDYGEDHGLLYISMEFVEGVDLKQIVRASGPLSPETAFDVAIQVAEGLQAVHDAGIVHRDLKTPNIMLDSQGMARLMDFGVAKRLGDETLTATGHIVGTPEYMSPEQAQGRKADFRSDLYALGIVVYEIFTGHVPFRGDTPLSTILKHLNDPPPLEGTPAARLPRALRPILRRALAKEPEDRQGNARELADALRQARAHPDRAAPPAEPAASGRTLVMPSRARSAKRRRSLPLQTWLLVVPLLAVGGGVLVLQTRTREAVAPPAPTVAEVPSTTAPVPAAAPSAAAPPATIAVAPRDTAVEREETSAAARPRIPPATRPPAPAPVPATRGAGSEPPPVVTTIAAPPTTIPPPAPVSEAPGLLQLAVKPWGTVWVDGRSLGDTPLGRIELAAGTHTLRVRHPAYEIWEKPITIRPGQTERIVVDLAKEGVRKRD